MATLYKVEIEVVSDWVNFDSKSLSKRVKERIECAHPLLKQELRVIDIKVKKK